MKSRLKRIAADEKKSIGNNAIMQAKIALRKLPDVLKYFPNIKNDLNSLRGNDSFQVSNERVGLVGDMSILDQLVTIYQEKNIATDDPKVNEDYQNYITGVKTAQDILNQYATNYVITQNDINEADAFLKQYKIIGKVFPALYELIINKSLHVSSQGLKNDLISLLTFIQTQMKQLNSASDESKVKIKKALDKFIASITNNSLTIIDAITEYNQNMPQISKIVPEQKEQNKSDLYNKSTPESRRKQKPTKVRNKSNTMTPQMEAVQKRIISMLNGNATEQTIKAELDIKKDLNDLYALYPQFKEHFAKLVASGYPTFTPGELEKEIILLIKFAKRVIKLGADKNQVLAPQIQDIFRRWIGGTHLSSIKPNSKRMREIIEWSINQQQILEAGEEAARSEDVIHMLNLYGFKFWKNTKEYNEFWQIAMWIDKYDSVFVKKRQQNIVIPAAIEKEYDTISALWTLIQNKLKKLYDKLAIEEEREKGYMNKATTFWNNSKEVATLKAYCSGIKASKLDELSKLEGTDTITPTLTQSNKTDEWKPDNFSARIWKTFTDEEKAAVKAKFDKYGAGIFGKYGQIIPMAVAFHNLSNGAIDGKTINQLIDDYDNKIIELLKNDQLEEARTYRVKRLNYFLKLIETVIIRTDQSLTQQLPSLAIKHIDTESDSQFAWLNIFTNRIAANINNLLDFCTILHPSELFQAFANAVLASAGDYVQQVKLDKTKENFVKKVQQLDREMSADGDNIPYAHQNRVLDQTPKLRTPTDSLNINNTVHQIHRKNIETPTAIETQTLKSLNASATKAFRRLARRID